MDMNRRLDAVQRAREAATEKALQAAEAERRVRQELAVEIKAGNSTGDRIRDYVLVHWSGDERVVERLKKLEGELNGMVGQYVFAVLTEREWHTTGNGGGFGPSGYEELRKRELSLGVLTDDKLILDMEDGHFGFRTGGEFSWIDTGHKTGLHPGDMLFEKDHIFELPAIIQLSGGHCTLDLIIGTDKVMEWLEHGQGIPINFREGQFGCLAMKIQAMDELPPKLADQQRQRIAQFNADVEKAMNLFESSRAMLLDIKKKMSNPEVTLIAVDLRNALNDLKRLKKVAADLGVDPKLIDEYLAKING